MRKPAIVLKCHSPDQKHNTQLMTSSAHQGKPWTHRRAQVSWVAPHGGLLGNGAERVTPVAPTEGRFLRFLDQPPSSPEPVKQFSRCHSSTHLAPISAPTTIASCTPDMARATPIRAPYPSCVCAASQGTAAGHRVEARPATELRMPLVKPSSCKWSPVRLTVLAKPVEMPTPTRQTARYRAHTGRLTDKAPPSPPPPTAAAAAAAAAAVAAAASAVAGSCGKSQEICTGRRSRVEETGIQEGG
ncbi:hypothetical protein Vafri_17640 [Volvox africanus]|uniref:Uncharacterized protein n=1 Tax=Volvox africanus TaxID=51714 RepID=A0A8J4FAY3_9CHLO|nr:hypothetical protein Vafri_17640 [Volvox africanus]